MEFEFVENQKSARIKVIGIGGAGNNAVNNMIASGLSGVAFIAANTDLQALENNSAPTKLQLGVNLTTRKAEVPLFWVKFFRPSRYLERGEPPAARP